MKKTVLIDIVGGGVSGRTSIPVQLKGHYKDTSPIVIIRQNDYYKDQSEKTMEERVKMDYDHPFVFDNELFVVRLQRLLQRQSTYRLTCDFVHHTRSEVIEEIKPSGIVVIEGLFILENEDLRNLCDVKIFVDADADIRFICRLLWDVNERGEAPESVMEWYTSIIRDMHNLSIRPSKHCVDVIIPEGGHNVIAIDLLIMGISSVISENVV